MTRSERKSVLSLAMLYATRMLGLFMVLPVFVLFGQDLQGADSMLLGIAIGAYGLSQALFQIPFGSLSDRFGRKPVMLVGLLIFFAGSVIAAMSESIYGVILGRFIQGAGAIASVIMALASDLTSVESRTKAMAFIGMSIGMSFMLALVLGPLIAGAGGLQAIFWLTAVLALCAIGILLVLIPNPKVLSRHRDAQVFSAQIGGVLKDTQLLRLDFGIFALHAALTAMFIAIPVSLVEGAGIEEHQHWWVYLLVLLGSFVAMIPFIIVGEKHQRMKEVFCLAVSLLALASISMLWTAHVAVFFLASLFLFFMGFNLLEASLPSLVSKISPAGVKGTAMGVYSTSQFFGAFVGGSLGGWMLSAHSEHGVYMLVAVLCLIWLLLAVTMAKPKHEKSIIIDFDQTLNEEDISVLSQDLIDIDGVEDVVVVPDGVAYLKVASKMLDEPAIDRVKQRFGMRTRSA